MQGAVALSETHLLARNWVLERVVRCSQGAQTQDGWNEEPELGTGTSHVTSHSLASNAHSPPATKLNASIESRGWNPQTN